MTIRVPQVSGIELLEDNEVSYAYVYIDVVRQAVVPQ
jgi:hypothetical protein